jgi:flagellar hook-basal body protein
MADSIEQISASVDALLQDFDIIAHNLANVSTVGYKRRCSVFTETLKAQQSGAQEQSNGSVTAEAAFDFSQGHIVETGRPLDFALFGKGLFVIETPDGPLYTRNGTFHINQNSQIVNSDGRIVAGQAGPITVPTTIGPSQLNVAGDGKYQRGWNPHRQIQIGGFRGQPGETGAGGIKLLSDARRYTTHCRRKYRGQARLSGGIQCQDD